VNARNARYADRNARSRCGLIVMDCGGGCAGVLGKSAGSGESQHRRSANRDRNRSHFLLLSRLAEPKTRFVQSRFPYIALSLANVQTPSDNVRQHFNVTQSVYSGNRIGGPNTTMGIEPASRRENANGRPQNEIALNYKG
jgi:hypothetical protein